LYQEPRSFLEGVHRDDRKRVLDAIDEHAGCSFDLEYRVVRPDNSIRWIRDRRFPIKDDAAQAYRIAGIAEDITERKMAAEAIKRGEDQIRFVIDTIPIMVWSTRPDGAVDFVNQRWLDYCGVSLAEELADSTRTMHPEDVARVLKKWADVVATGEPYEDEMRLRRADGTYRWFLVRTAPLRDEQGVIVKWFGCSIDIEDRKTAAEALRLSRHQLQELVGRLNSVREDEAKRIARELHDDLGQKLTALNMGLADLEMKMTDTAPEHRRDFERMRATVDQTVEAMQELCSDLRLGPLDILGLTAAIDWQLREFSRRSGIVCVVTRLDEITNLAEPQSRAVFRILQEALTNILRHSGARSVEISLQGGPDQVGLRIRDNGRGIAAAELRDVKALGLLGMRERAQSVGAAVLITGGNGTTVMVTVPLTPAA
jgi:PAS domain S-box-containing protein